MAKSMFLTIYGNAGGTFNGGAGNDYIRVGVDYPENFLHDTNPIKIGSYRIIGNDGHDTLIANGGNDYLNGGLGDDVLISGHGNDTLMAGDGNDILFGDFGNDILLGGAGNDSLMGGAGTDRIDGGTGDDVIYAGAGDTVKGGSGQDLLRFQAEDGLSGLIRVDDVEQLDLSGLGVRHRLPNGLSIELDLEDISYTKGKFHIVDEDRGLDLTIKVDSDFRDIMSQFDSIQEAVDADVLILGIYSLFVVD